MTRPHNPIGSRRNILLTGLMLLLVYTPAAAQYSPNAMLDADALSELSIEELTQVKVTSAAKREQRLNDVASAMYVITHQDIQRSTATTIPELLRMVPGLYVAQVGASTWSITSRGLGGVFSNKLLVLIDGRTVYTPLFSGTYWEVQDYPLHDIERIEVIRGPGGTLWGSNAVNGVINIITKRATDTQGGIASLQAGKEALGVGSVRYGATSGDTAYSTYARGRLVDNQVRDAGGDSADGYNSAQAGFKLSQMLCNDTEVELQGDIYSLNRSEVLIAPNTVTQQNEEFEKMAHSRGGNILGKVTTPGLLEKDKASVQFYYDRANREELVARSAVGTYDLELQYDLSAFENHAITFGGGTRTIHDSTGVRRLAQVIPSSREYSLVNGFIQDEYAIIPSKLSVTGGIKFEHNEFTGGVWQPSLKTLWHTSSSSSLWASVSRAVRIPSRVTNDLKSPVRYAPPSDQVPLPALVELRGSRDAQPEVAIAYELGFRSELSERVALDTTAFLTNYNRLQTFEFGAPEFGVLNGAPSLTQPLNQAENGEARIWGVESVVEAKLSQAARVQFWHVFQHIEVSTSSNTSEPSFLAENNNNPLNQFAVRGQFNLSENIEWNPMVRFIEDVPAVHAPSYWQLDTQLAWNPQQNLRFSLNGVNLLSNDHAESSSEFIGRPLTRIERAYYFGVQYLF